jgi:malonyl-CoA O-methyltransferase
MEVEQRAVLGLLPPLAGLTVLDAGCGTGRYARLARAAGAASVIGVDRSAAMLAAAASTGACRLIRADTRALPIGDRTCGVVISGLMLPDVSALDEIVREWRRVLRPGGVIVCSTLHPIGAELGWTRTFETAHGIETLPAHWHSLADHRQASAAAGLIVDAVVEPGLEPPHRPPATASRVPVALVLRLRRSL